VHRLKPVCRERQREEQGAGRESSPDRWQLRLPAVCELQEKTALAHADITDDDVLEQIRVTHGATPAKGL
jgi:hypothetical protein